MPEKCPICDGKVIGLSKGLIMSRDDVHKSCLMAPSGAALTWMEMFSSGGTGQKKEDMAWIDDCVKRVVAEYGDVLKKLASE